MLQSRSDSLKSLEKDGLITRAQAKQAAKEIEKDNQAFMRQVKSMESFIDAERKVQEQREVIGQHRKEIEEKRTVLRELQEKGLMGPKETDEYFKKR